jgi:putative transposase
VVYRFSALKLSNFRQFIVFGSERSELLGSARKYRRYPDSVKLEVVRARNPYRFPELKIPRTTALYWLQTAREVEDLAPQVIESERVQKLCHEIERQNGLLELARKVRRLCPAGFSTTLAITRTRRKRLIELIQDAATLNRIDDCLEVTGLTKNLYSQWLSEFFLCQSADGQCDQRRPHQLTADELNTMRRLVVSKKHAHISIASLCLLAQREGLLFCSIDSWYKYIQIFAWDRPREKPSDAYRKDGIRAKGPNEIWHVDVTQVKTKAGQTIYVQVVYDNFSRFIIAWKVTTSIGGLSTVDLLEKARKKAQELGGPQVSKVMMDGGPENDNSNVLKFVTSRNFKRLIALVDIHFSNSMVESLFRCLKSNFLNGEDIHSEADVEMKCKFYFNEHNDKIPKAIFKGATPKEMFLGLWNEQERKKLKDGLKAARENRSLVYQARSCPACDDKIPYINHRYLSRAFATMPHELRHRNSRKVIPAEVKFAGLRDIGFHQCIEKAIIKAEVSDLAVK